MVRSEHAEESGQSFEGRYDYDHEAGRPIFRAFTSTSVDPTPSKLSARLEVTECRFGPIPESEFALEPFLARLQPGEIILEAGRGTLDRDGPRLVLAGVRRRRYQPGMWVWPGTENQNSLPPMSIRATVVRLKSGVRSLVTRDTSTQAFYEVPDDQLMV